MDKSESLLWKNWIPYVGPRGGTGWQNTNDPDDVEYQKDPPGEAVPVEDVVTEVMRLDSSVADALKQKAIEADEMTELLDTSEVMHEALGELVRRLDQSAGPMHDIDEEQAETFFNSYIEKRVEDAKKEERQSNWLSTIEDEMGSSARDSANSQVSQGISEQVEYLAGAVDKDEFEEEFEDRFDQGVRPMMEDGTISDMDELEEAIHITLRDTSAEIIEQSDPVDLIDFEKFEDADKDLILNDFADAAQDVHGYWGDIPEAIRNNGDLGDSGKEMAQSLFTALEDAVVNGEDKPQKVVDELRQIEDQLADEMFPFRNLNTTVPDSFNPANAEEVTNLRDDDDVSGGRSAGSMFIAEGVPDEDGNKRTLFVTNTNGDRGRKQRPEDGERCTGASAALREVGFSTPVYYNDKSEFWVAEEAPGKVAAKDVDYTDLEDPAEQFAEMGAACAVIGAWDMHEGNVFIDPDQGEMFPVDLDLAGAALHEDADAFNNKFSASKSDLSGRLRRLASEIDLLDVEDWDDLWEMIQEKSKEMAEDGTAQEIQSAFTGNCSEPELNAKVEENRFKLESGDFWQ